MREIRSYGSARGVRSNPYPYRDILQPLRSSVSARHPKLWFHRQTVAYHGILYLTVQESPEFVYELHRRRQLIDALTARAHWQPIHKSVCSSPSSGSMSAKRIIV
jgi:hypothetical protein